MRASGDPRVGSIVFYGVIGVLLTVIIILGLEALYHHVAGAELQRKVYAEEWQDLVLLRSQQEAELNSYRWVSEKEGVVGIPIDLAIELTADELQDEQSEPRDRATGTQP